MTYEYVCTACAHTWEAEQSISAAALKTCPSCQAETAKRQVSGGAGFILKGGGWYADLYSSAKSGKKDEGASPAAPGTKDSGGEKKGEVASSSTPTSTDSSSSSGTTSTTSTTGTSPTPAKPSAVTAS